MPPTTPTSVPPVAPNTTPDNIFEYGGNVLNTAGGIVAPVAPTARTLNGNILNPSVSTPSGLSAVSAGSPPPDVSNLPTSYQLTGPETNAQSMSDQLEALNNELVGKSAATTAAQNAAGLPALNQQQSDLSAQLAQLKAAASAIPSAYQNWATGRGVTAAGLEPLQSAATRNNSVQALSISAMLDATNGLIASANDKVKQVIDAKYGPIQEQIDAATANLKLIQNSPDYTQSEKAQAQAQLDAQNAKQAALDKAKTNQANIYNVALEAAKNGADAATLQKIQNAKTPEEAMANAGGFLKTKQNNQVVTLKNGNTVIVDPSTGSVVKNLGGAPPPGLDLANLIGTPALDSTTAQSAGTGKSGDILSATGLSLPVFNYLTQGTGALSRMSATDRAAVMAAATAYAKNNGVDVSTLQSQYKAYNDVLQKNIERANNTSIFANEVSGSADALLSVIDPSVLGKTGGILGIGQHTWTAANIVALAAGQQINDPIATKYAVQLQAVTNDLAGYFAASRGANIPENVDIQDAADVISKGLNSGSIQAFKDAIQTNEQKVNKVVNDAVSRSQKQVWGLFGVGDQYQSNSQSQDVGSTTTTNDTSYPEGTTAQGDDGATYIMQNGQWVKQ